MVRQARMLPLDLGESHWPGQGPRCVLVHGLYATAGVWRPLREMLKSELGFTSSTFSYGLGPGIRELRGRLEQLIDRIVGEGPIHLIGHSVGGLVVSDYVQNGRLDPRVVQTLTLCAPFRGTRLHRLVPGDAGRDIAVDSPLLPLLRAGNPRRVLLPQLTIEASWDSRIEPLAFPEFGDRQLIAGVTHNAILFDRRAWQHIADRLRGASAAQS
jgi:pimeloyl-ACP methyl ester carboxylesterase